MTENLAINLEDLFQEIVTRGREQGVADQAAYNELVDTVVQEKIQVGEDSDQADIEERTKHLQGRWEDYQQTL